MTKSLRLVLGALLTTTAASAFAGPTATDDSSTMANARGAMGWGGYDGKIATASLLHDTDGTARLAITSRPGHGIGAELTSSHRPDTSNKQHAIDDVSSSESLMSSFQGAITRDA